MATQEQTVTLSGLARTLVRGGYIDQQSAERVLTESRKKKTNYLNQVVTDKLVSSTAIASAAAQEFGMCMVAIDLIEIDPEIVKLVNAELIKKHNGKVPKNFDELFALPGVGKKTASVVLNEGFGLRTIAVDTHVF